jgi:hypothetical protein
MARQYIQTISELWENASYLSHVCFLINLEACLRRQRALCSEKLLTVLAALHNPVIGKPTFNVESYQPTQHSTVTDYIYKVY